MSIGSSLAAFMLDDLALGAEWRAKPDPRRVFRQENASDVFVAWFAHRNVSLSAACAIWVLTGCANVGLRKVESPWLLKY
jgi:hypothetical protein